MKNTQLNPPRERITLSVTWDAYDAVRRLDLGLRGTPDYMGVAWFWHYELRHYLRSATHGQRQKVHRQLLKSGLPLNGDSEEHQAIAKKICERKPKPAC